MKRTCKRLALAAAGTIGLSALAPAAVTFAPADLILGIQATGGQGASTNLFLNLGSTTGFLANGNQGLIGNISDSMTATYGSGWFDRADLWFGAAGNRSNLSPTIDPGALGEEPGRTWYVSSAAANPGSAILRPAVGGPGLGSGGTFFSGLKNALAAISDSETPFGEDVLRLNENDHPVEWNNSWTEWNPTPGAGFGIWTGGIQNSFGSDGDIVWIDVQRLVAGTQATYVTSIGIGRDGSVYAVPEPSSLVLLAGAAAGAVFFRRRKGA